MLVAMIIARRGTYIIEQPRQSLLYRHPRFVWLSRVTRVDHVLNSWRSLRIIHAYHCINCITQATEVYRSCWWMGLYSDPDQDENWSPKRQISWSNSRFIWSLDRGQLRRRRVPGQHSQTARRYQNASGRVRWTGTKKLKATEMLVCMSVSGVQHEQIVRYWWVCVCV